MQPRQVTDYRMPKIKELLELNLDVDIKNVIDLEDQAEDEIRYEIENYIS